MYQKKNLRNEKKCYNNNIKKKTIFINKEKISKFWKKKQCKMYQGGR